MILRFPRKNSKPAENDVELQGMLARRAKYKEKLNTNRFSFKFPAFSPITVGPTTPPTPARHDLAKLVANAPLNQDMRERYKQLLDGLNKEIAARQAENATTPRNMLFRVISRPPTPPAPVASNLEPSSGGHSETRILIRSLESRVDEIGTKRRYSTSSHENSRDRSNSTKTHLSA